MFEADRQRYLANPASFWSKADGTPCELPQEVVEKLLLTATIAELQEKAPHTVDEPLRWHLVAGRCDGGSLDGEATIVGSYKTTMATDSVTMVSTYQVQLTASFAGTAIDGLYRRYLAAESDVSGPVDIAPPHVSFEYGRRRGESYDGPSVSFNFGKGGDYTMVTEEVEPGVLRTVAYLGPTKNWMATSKNGETDGPFIYYEEEPDGAIVEKERICYRMGEQLADATACADAPSTAQAAPGSVASETTSPSATETAPPSATETAQPGPTEAAAPPPETGSPRGDAASRLKTLKELHEQGLIDKPTYERKKKEVIDSL